MGKINRKQAIGLAELYCAMAYSLPNKIPQIWKQILEWGHEYTNWTTKCTKETRKARKKREGNVSAAVPAVDE